MIKAIRTFFDTHIGVSENASEKQQEQALRLATASLLVEVMRADFNSSQQERRTVKRMLAERFELDVNEVEDLVELAEHEVDEAVSLFQFTELVDKSFDYDQKLRAMQMLWNIVYADGRKDKHEEYLLRKIADLIHVSHKDFIRTRLIAEGDGN